MTGHERLAGHVAAEDQDVGLVVRARSSETCASTSPTHGCPWRRRLARFGIVVPGQDGSQDGKNTQFRRLPNHRRRIPNRCLAPARCQAPLALRLTPYSRAMPRDPRFDILFEPVQIGPKTLRNRFYQVPHCTGFGVEKPWSQAAHRAVKAEGGWAAVCTEYCTVSTDADETPYISARMWDDHDLRHLALLCDAAHAHGALAGIELSHSGAHGENCETRLPPPGAVADRRATSPASRRSGWSSVDIDRIISDWVRAAVRSRDAGFDIVYVYGGHSYLLGQMLSPFYNQRTDEYGGSLENRARMWIETLAAVREAVGSDCAIACRDGGLGGGRRRASSWTRGSSSCGMADHLVDLWDVHIGSILGVVEGLGRVALLRRGLAARVDRARARGDGEADRRRRPADDAGAHGRDHRVRRLGSDRRRPPEHRRPVPAREDPPGPVRRHPRVHRLQHVHLEGRRPPPHRLHPERDGRRGAPPRLAPRAVRPGGERRPRGARRRRRPGRHGVRDRARPPRACAACAWSTPPRSRAASPAGSRACPAWPSGTGCATWRLGQLAQLRNVEIETGVRMDAAGVRAAGADLVVVATGAAWAGDGRNGVTRGPIPGADAVAAARAHARAGDARGQAAARLAGASCSTARATSWGPGWPSSCAPTATRSSS